jgi:hypothetical protein
MSNLAQNPPSLSVIMSFGNMAYFGRLDLHTPLCPSENKYAVISSIGSVAYSQPAGVSAGMGEENVRHEAASR